MTQLSQEPAAPRRKFQVIETRSIDYVPLAERHGKPWHLWPVWFMGSAHLVTLSVGIIGIEQGTNLLWTAIAIVTGCLFGTFFMASHSAQGPQMGLPQLIQSRPQFGYLGALLVYGVALVTYIGYNSMNQIFAGSTLQELLDVPASPGSLVFAGLGIALAVAGYDWFHLLQRWFAVALISVLLIYTIGIAALGSFPAAQFDPAGFRTTPFIAEFFAAAAYQLSWAIYVSDYSRYLPKDVSTASTLWWTYGGAFLGGAWMMLLGALAAALHPSLNFAAALVASADLVFPGFGRIVLVLSILGLVCIEAQNFYGASITLLSVVDTIKPIRAGLGKRLLAMLVVASAALAIAAFASKDFVRSFPDFLSVLLYLFTPWTAINLVDFYIVRHGHFSIREIFNPHGIYGRWNWRGISAYFLGFAAMAPFFSTGLYTGPVARALDGADVAMPVGLLVSGLYYWWVCRAQDIAGELGRIAALDRGLEPVAE